MAELCPDPTETLQTDALSPIHWPQSSIKPKPPRNAGLHEISGLEHKWQQNPQSWEEFPPDVNGEYLMLWPGQYSTLLQKQKGAVVASSMRQVDGSAELTITQGYAANRPQSTS